MSLTFERIEALAPDQASLAAARKLLKPSYWPTLAQGEGLVWGECQGSGATPYRVVINEADAGYKCTCPSRKFPCKHALALMWMRADRSAAFAAATVPDWVKDRLSRRRAVLGFRFRLMNSPRETFFDPARLKKAIPGCEKLEAVGPDEYKATMKVGVGGVAIVLQLFDTGS